MSYVVTQAALEAPQTLQGLYHQSAHFPELSFPVHAPWLYSALSQLWDLEQGGDFVQGFGNFRVAAQTGIRVRKLLSRVGDVRDLPAPSVNVFSGGGITLSWDVGSREVKFTFWPEGVLTFWHEDQGQTVGGDELENDDLFQPRESLNWLLKA